MKLRLCFAFLWLLGHIPLGMTAYTPPKCQGIQYYPFVFQECLNGIFKQYKGTQCYNLAGNKDFYQSCVNSNFVRLGLIACTQIKNNPYGFENCVNTQIRNYAKTKNAVVSTMSELDRPRTGLFERNPREEEKPVVNDEGRTGLRPLLMDPEESLRSRELINSGGGSGRY